MNLKINICREANEFRALETRWNVLLNESQQNNIFLTWEWLYTWWITYGDTYRLYIMLVEDPENNLIGIAPFKIAKRYFFKVYTRYTLEFIGVGESPTPELLNIISKPGFENTVSAAIMTNLMDKKEFDTYDLWPFAENSPFIHLISNSFKTQNYISHIERTSTNPIACLPNSWEGYWTKRSRNFRKKMKEYIRVYQRDIGIELIQENNTDTVRLGLDPLIRLHTTQRNENTNSFRDETNILFHKRIADLFSTRGWLRLFYLKSGEKIVAGIYCYHYCKNYYYYQSGRDLTYAKYHIGYVLINLAIKQAINEGATIFNFLTGNEQYKYRWATDVKHSVRLFSWGKKQIIPEFL
jgi:hypothetical protein